VFSSKNLCVIQAVTLRSLICFELIFVHVMMCEVQVDSFACGYTVILVSFAEIP
jgi:hypothetical protein